MNPVRVVMNDVINTVRAKQNKEIKHSIFCDNHFSANNLIIIVDYVENMIPIA